jgi:hypothetical protein
MNQREYMKIGLRRTAIADTTKRVQLLVAEANIFGHLLINFDTEQDVEKKGHTIHIVPAAEWLSQNR